MDLDSESVRSLHPTGVTPVLLSQLERGVQNWPKARTPHRIIRRASRGPPGPKIAIAAINKL
jgi:hypothetical protein